MGQQRRRAASALAFAVFLGASPHGAAQAPVADDLALLGYRQVVVPGPILRVETSEGVFRIALFSQQAPKLTQAFLDRVADGAFVQAGFGRTGKPGVQLGSPGTDVFEGGAREVFSSSAGWRAPRDRLAIPFMATRGAHGFESTGLKPIAGSVLIDQRFIVDGQLFRREYFIALDEGFPRGEVVGHVISGLDIVRRLDSRDALQRITVE